MKKHAGKFLKFLLFFGLGILLVWLATYQLTPEQRERIRISFREAHYWLLLPVLLTGVASHLFRALRWRLLMAPLDLRPTVFNTFAAVMIGYLANLAIPRMGEITRCGVLARNERMPVDKLIGTMIAERAFDLVCLLLLLFITLVTQLDVLGDFFYKNIVSRLLHHFRPGSGFSGMLLILGAVLILFLLYWILRRFRQTRWYDKIRHIVLGVRDGIASIGRLRQKRLFFLYTLLIWGCYLMMVYVGFFCLDATSHLGFKAALAVLGLGSIGMIATQGGIGAYQLLTEKTLSLYGIGPAVGYAFGWISWLAQTFLIIIVGFVCILLLPLLNNRHHGQDTGDPAKDSHPA